MRGSVLTRRECVDVLGEVWYTEIDNLKLTGEKNMSKTGIVIVIGIALILSGALSARLVPQLGKTLPWFRLMVYLIYLGSALFGLLT